MGTLNTADLVDLANITFEDFKILDSMGQNRAKIYYMKLNAEAAEAGLANTINYASLAESVVTGDSLNGLIANLFTQAAAEKQGVDFSSETSVGKENRLRMEFELM